MKIYFAVTFRDVNMFQKVVDIYFVVAIQT